MFTGIVQEVGTVSLIKNPNDMLARIEAPKSASGLGIGSSVACDGICLTMIDTSEFDRGWFEVQVSNETAVKTCASNWTVGRKLNIERSLRVGDELGGHIVTGHIDGVCRIVGMEEIGGSIKSTMRIPDEFAELVAAKGSIALNGVSLTVNEVSGNEFSVNLIPHTRKVTTWGESKVGDLLNFEIDVLARYLKRMMEVQKK